MSCQRNRLAAKLQNGKEKH